MYIYFVCFFFYSLTSPLNPLKGTFGAVILSFLHNNFTFILNTELHGVIIHGVARSFNKNSLCLCVFVFKTT